VKRACNCPLDLHANSPPNLFLIGTQGVTAIYASGGSHAALRRIVNRSYSWWDWIYPLPS